MYGVTNKPNNYFSDYNAAKTTKFAGSKTADDKSTKKADTFESSVKNYTEIDESIKIQPAEKANQPEKVELSTKAQNYLDSLKEKYGNMDFIIADFKTDEEAQALMENGTGSEYNVVITPDLLEKMANDESVAAQYESVLDNAAEQFGDMKDTLADHADDIKSYGISIDSDGKVNYYVLLKDGLEKLNGENGDKKDSTETEEQIKDKNYQERKTQIIKAETLSELLEKLDELKKEADEKAEQQEKINNADNIPPKSFEKYQKEPDPNVEGSEYGELPPESFKKYQEEVEWPDVKEATLPPKSFERYTKAAESAKAAEEEKPTLNIEA